MTKFTKKAESFLHSGNQDLQYIFAKVRKLNEVNDKVLAHIEPDMRKYCQVANVAGNKLILLTANSSVATQIRLLSQVILRKLQRDPGLKHIKEIQTKVGAPKRPLRAPPAKPKEAVELLSAESAKMMLDFAETIDDPKLREVMERLAKNTK